MKNEKERIPNNGICPEEAEAIILSGSGSRSGSQISGHASYARSPVEGTGAGVNPSGENGFDTASRSGFRDYERECRLNGEDVLEQRVLQEFQAQEERKLAQSAASPRLITEFAELDETHVFSEFAHYKLLNRDTQAEFFITGKMLESKIGQDAALYEKVKRRAVKAFCVGNQIVKFCKFVENA